MCVCVCVQPEKYTILITVHTNIQGETHDEKTIDRRRGIARESQSWIHFVIQVSLYYLPLFSCLCCRESFPPPSFVLLTELTKFYTQMNSVHLRIKAGHTLLREVQASISIWTITLFKIFFACITFKVPQFQAERKWTTDSQFLGLIISRLS